METNNQNSENENRPEERPETPQTEQEGSGYVPQREQEQQSGDNEGGFSEQIDVTPPSQKEFPSEHNIETDFSSRPHGRSTGRMLGHEPGTEGL